VGIERVVFGQPDDSDYRTKQALVRFDAKGWQEWEFRVTGDFTPINGQPAARLYDLYVRWLPDAAIVLTVGLTKMPTGLDRVMSFLYTEGIERPITATFQSGFEPGIVATGVLANGVFHYAAGLSEGKSEVVFSSNLEDSEVGLDQGTREINPKGYLSVTVSPFAEGAESALRDLRLGLFAAVNYTSGVDLFSAYKIKSPDFSITWLSPASAANELFFEGRRVIAGADPTWSVGPFLARGEFLYRRDRVARPAANLETPLDVLSWSGVASFMLTGEHPHPGMRIPPEAPLEFSRPGFGSLDVHVRASGAHFDKSALQKLGTNLVKNTNDFTGYAAGVNWWPESNVRISSEYTFEDYHQPIVVNSAKGMERSLQGVQIRFQVDF
jgi:phosphate-selective porin